jgi:Domain of unknown function (DUF4190)
MTAAPVPPPAVTYQPLKTNGLAIASLVLGVLFCTLIGGVLAVIMGNLALGQIDQSYGTQKGRGLAIAGIVLGWIGIGLLAIAAFAWLGYGISNA